MTNRQKRRLHRKTIRTHRKYVRRMCFKMGIPLQGLLHDLSKYSHKEFSIYKYYDGTRSPHEVARDQLGYSPSWYCHKNKNKHHWEYWLDNAGDNNFTGIKMPYKYVIEMFADYIGASKAYSGKNFTNRTALDYHLRTRDKRIYHKDTKALLEFLLLSYAGAKTEKEFINTYNSGKKLLKHNYKIGNIDVNIEWR